MELLVLGIGQSLRGDDAAGLEAVRFWQEFYPQTAQTVQVEILEIPGLTLLDRLEGFEAVILVDALHASTGPGRLYRLGREDLAAFTPDSQSAHGWGVAETLALGQSLHPSLAQCRITLIGLTGEAFGMGTGLSTSVRAALPEAAAMIETEVHALLK